MDIVKSFIVNDEGEIQSVILEYKLFKRIEDLLLDQGLLKAMEEAEEDEEIDLEEARLQLHFSE